MNAPFMLFTPEHRFGHFDILMQAGMPAKKTRWWLLVGLMIAIAAEGAFTSRATAAEETDGDDAAREEATAALTLNQGAESGEPISIRSNGIVGSDMRLIGTAVVDGGSSVAIMQLSGGVRFVREGEEIVVGLRLVKVRRDRIEVDRSGLMQEHRLNQASAPVSSGDPVKSITSAGGEVRGRMARSLFYSQRSGRE